MKNKVIFIALSVIFISSSKALAQDPVFTQWENMPLYVNPALTGNFDGLIRLRAQHRNQWRSLLGDNSYKTSAVSAEYKFSNASVRKISVGTLIFKDKAGSLDFRNEGLYFTSSVVQPLGEPDKRHHSIALGLNVGWATRKLDLANAQWPGPPPTDINDKTSYPDLSTGLLWQYNSNAHFSYQLGGALHHINRPNVSFFDTGEDKLYHRFNLHGNVEIPVVQRFSMVPSFLYSSQGPSEQLTFGFNNRWYPKLSIPNFVQLGIFAKTTKNYSGTTDVNIYVLSATVEINSFLVGFSFDRFQNVESNAYEFSAGYTFGKHDTKGKAGNIGYSQAGIVE
jgi:type IX secretion system PorP/SprF family membrane protein